MYTEIYVCSRAFLMIEIRIAPPKQWMAIGKNAILDLSKTEPEDARI